MNKLALSLIVVLGAVSSLDAVLSVREQREYNLLHDKAVKALGIRDANRHAELAVKKIQPLRKLRKAKVGSVKASRVRPVRRRARS